MKFNRYVAFSIVAASVLCGAQTYTNNWNGGNFQNGDTVNINYDFSTNTPTLLTQNINLTNGTLTATINAHAGSQSCGIVACLSNSTTFGSSGANLNFNITAGNLTNNPGAFDIINGGSLTVDANITINASGNIASGIFRAQGNSNLTFNGDTTIDGNGNTAIIMGSGNLSINSGGGKSIQIAGNISTNGGTNTIKLDDGDKITGNYTGTGNGTLKLDIDNSTYAGNVTNNGTSNITIKNNGQLQGDLTTSGTKLDLTMNNGTITGNVSADSTAKNTISLSQSSIGYFENKNGELSFLLNKSVVQNGITTSSTSQKIDIAITSEAQLNGSSTLGSAANVQVAIRDGGKAENLTFTSQDNQLTGRTQSGQNSSNIISVTMNSGGNNKIYSESAAMLTIGSLLMSGNNTIDSESGNSGINLQVTGNASLTATNGGTNSINFAKGGITGTLTTSENTTFKAKNSTTFGSISHDNESFTATLSDSATINNGITTGSNSNNVNITLNNSSQLNGTSNLGSANSVELKMNDTSSGGNINFSGKANTLTASGTNTLQSVTMTGTSNKIQTSNTNGTSLHITGNVSMTTTDGSNTIFPYGSVTVDGTLTTQGSTIIQSVGKVIVNNGIRHSNGNLNAFFGQDSVINNGIVTTGGIGTARVNLNTNTQLNGNSSFANATNLINLYSTSQVKGNITFAGGTSTLTADSTSTIEGQIISGASAGITTHTLKNNATITGGIDTQAGAGKTTATFNNSSILQNGISTFHSDIDITFTNTSKAINEQFNVSSGTSNITFQDNAEMNQGKITTNNGGTSNITFKTSSKMINGEIETAGGNATLVAQDNAELSNTLTQSGGIFNSTFKGNSKLNGNVTQSGGDSNITFTDTSSMEGNIEVKGGTTNITFTGTSANIKGDILAGGTKNTVTFTDNTKLDGNLTLDGYGTLNGQSTVSFTKSEVTGNIQGYDNVDLTLTDTQVDGYLHQGASYNQIGLKATIAGSTIKGGFEGKDRSQNTIDITNSAINQGIAQNTGSLFLKSIDTTVSGSFTGTQSDNTLQILRGDFSSGDIIQTGGTLQGDIISLTNLKDFNGTDSINVIHLMDTTIQTITQSGGGLTLATDDAIGGSVTGTNDSQNDITITGSSITGKVSQNTGSMSLTLNNSNLNNSFESTNATANLYGTNTNITGDITLENSKSKGVFEMLDLTGVFKQIGGTSTITFANTTFASTTTLQNTESASLIFTKSKIKDINATKGISAINLSNSEMTNFNGNLGDHTVTLVSSNAGTFDQNNGALTLNLASTSQATSVTGKSFATLSIGINDSKITGDITNNGTTTIAMQKGEIGGDVKQTAGVMTFNAMDSTLKGKYQQVDGTTMTNFTNSSIENEVNLKTIANGTLSFAQNSKILQGFSVEDGSLAFLLLSKSSLEGGYTQDKGIVTGTVNDSTLADKMTLSNGTTNLSLYNSATLNGNVGATNHNTTILVDRSTINGDMTISGGSFTLTAQNGSTIQGNGGGINKSQVNVTNADFKLTLDTNSTFNGNITQSGNKQTILVKQGSTLNGDITNTDVTSSISVNNATITGNINQTRGNLALDLSNGGKIGGNVELNGSDTILSGSGMGNQIGGNFTQNDGTLTGSMIGLTLKGKFTQTGGTSSVGFINSTFEKETEIKDATNSSLTFDNSTLKSYITDGGVDNTLKLLNGSVMSGTLMLKNQAQTTLAMENSTLTGDNGTAITATGNSFLTFDTRDSTITGKIEINTGGLKGNTDNTSITGDITLTNTTSNVSFANTSTITGNLTATDGANTIGFDSSSITGNVSQENGTINLDLSNGSSIGGNLTFTNTTAKLTGKGSNNFINGNFLSDNSTLRGDASGLNLKGTFTQNNGSSSIAFRNNSLFEGKMTLNGGTSDINFLTGSGVRNEIEIKDQTRAYLGLLGRSFIQGNIKIENTALATLSAQSSSTINGDITLKNSATNFTLGNQSSYQGTLTQEGNTLNLTASNSTLDSTINLNNGSTNISISNGSNLTGIITAENNSLTMMLSNSSFNSMEAPQGITITNANFTLTASDNSIFGGNLTQSSNNANAITSNLTFNSNSHYSGTMDLDNVTLEANFNQSGIFSNDIKITGASASFTFDGSINGGVIQTFTANTTDLTITTTNQSHITINDLQMNGNTLNLTATNSSRLTANVTLNNTTTATYTANTNGNLNVNTHIANQASTLTVNINGGILQGNITQEPNGNNGFPNGEITLQNSGENGGRWAVTGDTQIKGLALSNTQEALFSDAIFASTFNSPLSFVDFTLNFDDTNTTSRVGKEIIRKPEPINGQPIPDAGAGQTYVRQLQANEISGNNGLFRVYADLGTNLADNILASKASGSHLIQVQYRAETFREIGGDRIVVAKVTDQGTSVSFKGTQSEIGLTKYDTEIIKENAADGRGFEWIIGQATPAGMSYSSKIVASILQSQYRSFMIEIDSLDQRLGDLEFIKRDKGFWIRSYIGSNTKEATDFSTLAKDDYYSIWSGFDYNSIGLTVHNYVGVFFNYTGISTESKDYTGKSSNIAFGFYNTFKAFSGFYTDLLAKYIYTMSEFNITNYSLAKNSPKIDNHKLLLNAEIGYSFYYGPKNRSGYIQPQFQVTSGYIHKTDLSVVDISGETINATIGRNFPVSIRTGVFWGQVFGEKIKSHIKAGTSLVYDVNSGGDLDFKDSSTQLKFQQEGDLRWVLSAATDLTFSEFFKLYASFNTSFFGNYNTTYSANIGMRFTFGRSNNYVRNVPMVYNPYTPPVVINDDRRTVPVVKRYTTEDINQNYVGKPRKIESHIQGNANPNIQQGNPTYIPTRQPHRDITDVVEFGEQQ